MNFAATRLTISLVLLLGPTLFVGWLGFREIDRLEEEVAISMARGTKTVLRSGGREFGERLESSARLFAAELDGQTRDVIEERLRRVPSAKDALRGAILLDAAGQALFPKRSTRPRGAVEPQLWPSPASRANPQWRPAMLGIAQAEMFSMQGHHDEALAHLETINIPKRPGPEHLRRAWTEHRARLAYETATAQRRVGQHKEACEQFALARTLVESIARPRIGSHALHLLSRLGEIECIEKLGGLAENPEARRQQLARITKLLSDIGHGDYHHESDVWLESTFGRAAAHAETHAAGDRTLEERIEDLRQRNNHRMAMRAMLDDVLERRIDFGRPQSGDALRSFPIYGSASTQLLALRAIDVVAGARRTRAWLVMRFDLVSLLSEPLAQLEARIAQSGTSFRIELLDEFEDDAGASERHTLGPPLLGFSLAAFPSAPEEHEGKLRRSILIKASLLLALALLAGAGAFVLVRTLRREQELAHLKTSFVGRVSHELKTPLALIRMYGETLALGRANDPAKIREFASVIATESDRLTAMIDNVLDFSKIEAGTKIYVPNETRLDLHLGEILESYRPHLEDEGFELRVAVLPPLVADVDQDGLTQAVVNLLSNARKYSRPEGSRVIEVGLRSEGEFAVLAVADDGIGVPPDEIEQVFETFYRASTAGERRGAGLGLALVKHFAESHGGSVGCRARDGGGSVFEISIPLREEEHTQRASA